MRVKGKSVRVIVVVLAVMAAAGATSTAASATDRHPCDNPTDVRGRTVQYCPLWTSNVPIREYASPNARIVDWLWYGGKANWFTYQCVGKRQDLRTYWNYWWALTLGDQNGRWGYVSQTYFRGGEPNERDLGLRTKSSWTC